MGIHSEDYKSLGLEPKLLQEYVFVHLQSRLSLLTHSVRDATWEKDVSKYPVLIFADWSPFGSKYAEPIATISSANTRINRRELSIVAKKCGNRKCQEVRLTLYSSRTMHHNLKSRDIFIKNSMAFKSRPFAMHVFSLHSSSLCPRLTLCRTDRPGLGAARI